jgi:hypothetical protein
VLATLLLAQALGCQPGKQASNQAGRQAGRQVGRQTIRQAGRQSGRYAPSLVDAYQLITVYRMYHSCYDAKSAVLLSLFMLLAGHLSGISFDACPVNDD